MSVRGLDHSPPPVSYVYLYNTSAGQAARHRHVGMGIGRLAALTQPSSRRHKSHNVKSLPRDAWFRKR